MILIKFEIKICVLIIPLDRNLLTRFANGVFRQSGSATVSSLTFNSELGDGI